MAFKFKEPTINFGWQHISSDVANYQEVDLFRDALRSTPAAIRARDILTEDIEADVNYTGSTSLHCLSRVDGSVQPQVALHETAKPPISREEIGALRSLLTKEQDSNFEAVIDRFVNMLVPVMSSGTLSNETRLEITTELKIYKEQFGELEDMEIEENHNYNTAEHVNPNLIDLCISGVQTSDPDIFEAVGIHCRDDGLDELLHFLTYLEMTSNVEFTNYCEQSGYNPNSLKLQALQRSKQLNRPVIAALAFRTRKSGFAYYTQTNQTTI